MQRLMIVLLCGFATTVVAPPASAGDSTGIALITSTAVTAGIIAVGGVTTTAAVLGSAPGRKQRLSAYLRENEPSVHHAFALGAGEAITEIASILDVPHADRPAFAAALRADRKPLLVAAYRDADVNPMLRLAASYL